MRNKSGFAKYEVLTVMVLLLAIFCFLGYTIFSGISPRKVEAMINNGINFSKAVTVNNFSFHNTENVYLGEVIDEELLKDIKNPLGSGVCSRSESKVVMRNGLSYVTLKCGKYLIDDDQLNNPDKVKIYEVSNWKTDKIDSKNSESKVLYNCLENGKEKYDEYYEELYFVSLINKDYGTSYYFPSDISSECEVTTKTFYRTKKEISVK